MKRLALMLSIMLVCMAAEPFDKAAAVKAYIARAEEEASEGGKSTKTAIDLLTAEIAKARRGGIVKKLAKPTVRSDKGEYKFRTLADRSKEVSQLESERNTKQQRLAELNAGKLPADELLVPLTLGKIGYAGGKICHVVQVIDDSTILADIHNSLASRPRDKASVLIRGITTVGVTDGSGLKLEQIFIVSGTERYDTAFGGTRTVFVLEPIDGLSAK